MPGWTKEKRKVVEGGFYAFLNRARVFSKDHAGEIILGQHLYDGQRRFIAEVFDALEDDIHKIYVLKSRQLGLSTIARALTAFLLGFHNGLKGACVFDTSENRNESRAELTTLISQLPNNLRFPRIVADNRGGVTLANNSKILFLSAGVKKTKTSGTLGRSLGLSLAHMSELCSYDNDEGLEAFENSLSDINPERLYIYESTARGPNRWQEMWDDARNDPAHCRCLFLGWWSKPSQAIPKDHPDYQLYGIYPPSEKEQARIKAVYEKYGHRVTPEQLAWIRRKMNPAAATMDTGDAEPEFEGTSDRTQEQPWTEQEAFQLSGATFFSPEVLHAQINRFVSNKFKNYRFESGDEFTNMRCMRALTLKESELRVWEEPEPGASYVVGVDPAYGENERNDRSSIQVVRCYADGCDQVAEYSSPLVTTRHLAWTLAALMGWYGETSSVQYVMELQGPGNAVFNAIRDLQVYLRVGHHMKQVRERGLSNIMNNVQTYVYSRPDAMGAGHNWHWITSHDRKVMIMEALRDYVSNGTFRIRSIELLQEMESVSREDDGAIQSAGSKKDDKVVAAALAVYCWLQREKQGLMARKATREAAEIKKRMSIKDQVALFQTNMLETFFKQKSSERFHQQATLRRASWRQGSGRRY